MKYIVKRKFLKRNKHYYNTMANNRKALVILLAAALASQPGCGKNALEDTSKRTSEVSIAEDTDFRELAKYVKKLEQDFAGYHGDVARRVGELVYGRLESLAERYGKSVPKVSGVLSFDNHIIARFMRQNPQYPHEASVENLIFSEFNLAQDHEGYGFINKDARFEEFFASRRQDGTFHVTALSNGTTPYPFFLQRLSNEQIYFRASLYAKEIEIAEKRRQYSKWFYLEEERMLVGSMLMAKYGFPYVQPTVEVSSGRITAKWNQDLAFLIGRRGDLPIEIILSMSAHDATITTTDRYGGNLHTIKIPHNKK